MWKQALWGMCVLSAWVFLHLSKYEAAWEEPCLFVCFWERFQIFETSNRLQVAGVSIWCNDRVRKCKQWCLHGWHKSPTWNACHLPSVSHQSVLNSLGWWAWGLLPSVCLYIYHFLSTDWCPLITLSAFSHAYLCVSIFLFDFHLSRLCNLSSVFGLLSSSASNSLFLFDICTLNHGDGNWYWCSVL